VKQLAAAFAAALGVTLARIRRDRRPPPPTPGDAIVVFGAAVWADGPSPELAARVDRAAELHRDGYGPVVLCCGGAGECDAMRAALQARGLPGGSIVTDEHGTTTRRALEAVARHAQGRWQRVVLVSSPYHLHRVRTEAERRGLPASTAAATLQPLAVPPRSRGEVRLLSAQLRRPLREALAVWWYALPIRRSTIETRKAATAAQSSARLAEVTRGADGNHSAEAPRLLQPVDARVTSTFGWRFNRWHAGVDFAADHGEAIFAAATGTVLFVGDLELYGRVVALEHGGGYATVYGHLSTIAVEPGEEVAGGHLVGTAGASGNAFGPHLHFELRCAGEPIDPLPHLPELTPPHTPGTPTPAV
jgi:uncharacterized SAM-binding protein YcdF (DUF218 family)